MDERLNRWLVEQSARATPQGALVRLELHHLAVGAKRGTEVRIEAVPETVPPGWAEAMAAMLHRAALDDANGIGDGTQRYAVQAYRAKTLDRIAARCALVIAAADVDEPAAGLQSEPPTSTGLVGQLMRHLESKERTAVERERYQLSVMEALLRESRSRTAALETDNAKLRRERLRGLELTEELLSLQQTRDLDAKRASAHIDALKDAAAGLKLLAPAVVNRLTRSKAMPETDPRLVAVQALLSSLSDEQRAAMLKTLSPTQQIALMELVQQPEPN